MKVFEKSVIAGITFKNRILRSATHEGMGDRNGRPMPQYAALIEKLAKGGVGGIITGNMAANREGRTIGNMIMIDSDEHIDDFKIITGIAKKYNTPLIVQLNHGGVHCIKKITGKVPVAPSKYWSMISMSIARELSEDEIILIIDSFVQAIVRARTAGFDGVQLHAAHGYLLSQFLSPAVNRRRDRWGGTTENRFRIISEIIRKARDKVGRYPILAKYSSHDGDPGGVTPDEGVRIAEHFQRAGFDAIEISCGGLRDGVNVMRVPKIPSEAFVELTPVMRSLPLPMRKLIKLVMPLMIKSHTPIHLYNVDIAERIKKSVDIPVIVVGGIRSLHDIEQIIQHGKADFISMSRPFIIEPHIVNKFMEGKQAESRCIDCGFCLFGCMSAPLRCYYGKLRSND